MSTALGIASVTYVLRDLLHDSVNDTAGSIGSIVVTSLPPDKINLEREVDQLNLFMYQATSNPGWRNTGLPSVNGDGDRINHPPLGLDLHYLLTAYGTEQFHTDILLGCGMQVFHEMPVLSRETIRNFLATPPIPALSTSELAEQIEQIRITQESLTIEDISKLWAAFGTRYRPTAAYKATVVLIESRRPGRPTLLVNERKIYVVPFHEPVIDKILSRSATDPSAAENKKIFTGDTLILSGKRLKNKPVEVSIGKIIRSEERGELTVTDSEIIFVLDSEIRAGIHAVRVIHPVEMGSPPEPHKGVTSKVETFVLNPEIEGSPAIVAGNIEIKVKPVIHESQRVILLLNKMGGGSENDPGSYKFQVPPPPPLSPPSTYDTIRFPITDIKPGSYLVRIQVDGGESPLAADSSGKYTSPGITIP